MKLYTATWCDPCQDLKRWMNVNNIKYTEVDVDELGKEGRDTLGIQSVPVLFDGEEVYRGREQIKPYLKRKLL